MTRPALPPFLRLLCFLILVAGAIWSAAFATFEGVTRLTRPRPEAADGIVALTGGVGRIELALRLLESGVAPRLLVSGVGRGADLAELDRRVHLTPSEAGRITLGHLATTTLGNAEETKAWVRVNGIHSLVVVTAGYHMPRALLEIARAVPDVTLIPAPVRPPAVRGKMEVATVRMLANEFDKYIAVRLSLTRRADTP